MFGSSKNNKSKETAKSGTSAKTTASSGLNTLVRGTAVEGNITAESDFRVDGKIKGTLTCKAKVIIGPSGIIEGEVRCQNAMIEGRLDGKIVVSELLNVRETAKINGEVKTNKLIVQAGAEFNVTCVMGNQQPVAIPSAGSSNGKNNAKKESRTAAKAAV
ncbi:MAG: polymer-forming cytoskeletal protein [Saprospiraceae bacterium]